MAIKRPLLFILSIFLLSCTYSVFAEEAVKPKVLYIDHEPGNYHLTIPQKKKFLEIAGTKGWQVTVLTGTDKEVIEKLGQGDFAKGYDIVVYNICVAPSEDLHAPYNIIRQNTELNIPTLMLHGSLHSFWPTYKPSFKQKEKLEKVTPEGSHKKVKAVKSLVEKWKKENPDKPFPAWPNLTGISSEKHGPRKPIIVKSLKDEHTILEGFTQFTTGETSELYNNVITKDDVPGVIAILEGHQKINDTRTDQAVILWEYTRNKAKTVCFTLGHDMAEWEMPEFQNLLINSVNYLIKEGYVE